MLLGATLAAAMLLVATLTAAMLTAVRDILAAEMLLPLDLQPTVATLAAEPGTSVAMLAGKSQIEDLFTDLRDGRRLLDLLEGLAGHALAKEKGFTRVHALNNVNRALQVLQKNNVELVNIGGADIVDGNHKLTLGLIWSIILHWQVKDVLKNIMAGLQQTNSEKILLSWVRQSTQDYQEVNVVNFTNSWSDGLAFNALIHSHRPDLFEWSSVLKYQSAIEKLDHAFSTAKQHLDIEKLLDPEDIATTHPDKKSIIMYVTSLFQVLPQQVTIEAIREVETLPRNTKVTQEEHFQIQHQQRYSQQITVSVAQGRVRTPSPSLKPRYKSYAYTQAAYVMSSDQKRRRFSPQPEAQEGKVVGSPLMEAEVHLDSYQSALEEVLTWLLSAEDALHTHGDVSSDVEEVKEQFHTHEGFMMELTSHQGSVGKVLQAGGKLLSEGKLSEDEENEIREQMNLLNSRWENLRVSSMERQTKLHEVLMYLQHQQLKQLEGWLTTTEARINRMETQPLGPDLEDVKNQVEEHKLLQEDLETEQVRVNSLTHMVVVVDESSGDSATAALEQKLQSLGERWAAICKWTEERWILLQEIVLKWQHFTEEQCLFDAWLMEKEEAVNRIQTTDFKDQNEMVASLRQLAVLKGDLEMKRQTMDKLCALSQDLLSAVKNKDVAHKLEARLEDFAQRWDSLVQALEKSSTQISQAVTTAQPSLTQTTVMETVTMVTTREQVLVKHAKEELPPPPPQKKRQIVVDSELRKRYSWMTRSEAILQSPEFAISRKEGNLSDLQERVNAIEREKPEKHRKLQDASRSAQALVEQMVNEGLNADDIKQASEQLNNRWVEFCQLLGERLAWLQYQNKILAFNSQLQQIEQAVVTAENWLRSQQPPAADPEPIKLQLEKCKDEVARLSGLQLKIEELKDQGKELKEKEDVPMFLEADIAALTNHYNQVLADLQSKETQLKTFLESLPPTQYKETVTTLLLWIQQSETRLSIPQVTVTEYEVMEQRLKELKVLQGSLQEQQSGLNYLTSTMEEVCQKAPVEISKKYRLEIEAILCRWKKLSAQLGEQCQKLEELMTKLQQFQNDTKTLQKWMAEVDVFLNEEWPALGDSEALEKQLEQCTALVNDIHTIQPSLNGINNVGQTLKSEAEPAFASKLQEELTELNAQWENICKQHKQATFTFPFDSNCKDPVEDQAYAKKSALKGGLDKTVSLRKDLSEMQEWITQAEEDYLERDFEYKTPEELKKAVEELKRAREEVQQKEVKVKLLTDSVNSFIAKAPPVAHEALKTELGVLTSNYQRLCSRLNGKCKTLEEVWACWRELLSYLETENRWLDELELKLRATDNIQGGAEEISEALDSLESMLHHPEDNRNQIRELAQTLTDGGILDELINEKQETFNTRWDELLQQAVRRQQSLEHSIQSAQETDKTMRLIQESLATIDRHLTAYITDRIDAAQIPTEAQKIQSELSSHESSLDEMKKRKLVKETSERVTSQIDVTQKKLQEVSMKFRLFQKPVNFEQRLLDCKRTLDDVKAQLPLLEMKSVEQDVLQSQLDQCMVTEGKQDLEKCLKLSRKLRKELNALTEWLVATDTELTKRSAVEGMPTNLDAEVAWGKKFYKSLSEVKLEVETVIKTGRQIVQKQQTENPKELDERLTALKVQYNEMGAQVTEGKQDLEKCLKLSRKLRKELNALTEWLVATDTELTKRSAVEGMPTNLDAEVAWGKAVQKETEKHHQQLKNISDLAEAVKSTLHGKENLVEDKVSLLNCNWIAVTSRAEEWLNLLLDYQKQMEIFDQNIAQITAWMYRAEILLDESEKQEYREEVLKAVQKETEKHHQQLKNISDLAEAVKSTLHGKENLVEDKVSLLNCNWIAVTSRAEEWLNLLLSLKAELSDSRTKVEAVRDQAEDLIKNRGDHCREVIEPTLTELNQRFEALSCRIKTGKASVSSREVEQYHADAQKWLEQLEAEVKQGENLKEEDFQKDAGDAEEGAVKELLQKGENLQQRVPDERKREEIRIKQHLLNSKYDTVKDLRSLRKKKALPISPQWYQYRRQTDNLLQWLDDIEKKVASLPDPRDEQKIKEIDAELEEKREDLNAVNRQAQSLSRDGAAKAVEPSLIQLNKRWQEIESKFAQFRRLNFSQIQTVYGETTVVTTEGVTVETSHVPSAYLAEIRCLLHSIAEVEFLLNSPEYWAGNFHNFSNQEDCLKNVKYNLGQLSSRVEGVHSKKAAALQSASPVETEQIQEALTQLDVNWEKLNKLYKDRHARFDRSVEKWRRFHIDLKSLVQWLTEAECVLAKMRTDSGCLDQTKAKEQFKV
ncbi:Dystrophin [Acipenser ruthenus]|uniref:Dystrophin n=1 Tax=Acipenser ruthenus TaxID=7906 RepID=A0A444U973_ACIRT|nr:Dystrophin [Acipenser ruthenus]